MAKSKIAARREFFKGIATAFAAAAALPGIASAAPAVNAPRTAEMKLIRQLLKLEANEHGRIVQPALSANRVAVRFGALRAQR